MTSGEPITRKNTWISIIPHLAMYMLVIAVSSAFGLKNPVIGLATYVVLIALLSGQILSSHNQGVRALKKGNCEAALPHFVDSYEFFQGYSWLDKWRYFVFHSYSKLSYREIALHNIAYCHNRLGHTEDATVAYEKILEEFPDNKMARTALLKMTSACSNVRSSGGNDR